MTEIIVAYPFEHLDSMTGIHLKIAFSMTALDG